MIPQYYIAHPYSLRTIFASSARTNERVHAHKEISLKLSSIAQ